MKFITSLKTKIYMSSIAVLSLVACSNASLYKGQLTVNSTAALNFCTTPAPSVTTDLKYIFVFDKSHSNVQNYFPQDNPPGFFVMDQTYSGSFVADPLGGTDPYGEKRYGSLIKFLKNLTTSANTYYSIIQFDDSPGLKQNWTTNLAGTITWLAGQCVNDPVNNPDPNCTAGSVTDGANTNYQGTLSDPTQTTDTNTVYGLIWQDVLNNQVKQTQGLPFNAADYVVFWVSDGAPYVQNAGSPQLQAELTILGEVQALANLQSNFSTFVNSFTLNTGFYHLDHTVPAPGVPVGYGGTAAWATSWLYAQYQDETADTYMQDMATNGHGQFFDFSSNNIDYTRFNVPARIAKYILRDFWIQNASAVWWNGTLMLDSDQDGIPDTIELQMGSNPNKYDSDGNGLGDGVEYRIYGSPCGDSKCANNANTRNPGGASPAPNNCMYKADPTSVYGDADCDFLNDYEEKILNSSPNSFDSNADWVPDQFEFISNISFLSGTNSLNADPENDGITDYFKLKQGLPVNYPASQIHGIVPLNYTLTQVSDNSTQTCYNVNVQDLATMSKADVIRIYVMENRGTTGSAPRMRVAQKITNGNLILNDSDFSP